MTPTRASLLLRIKDLHDRDAWRDFHGLYAPLIYHYARKRGLRREDAEEVRDQCFEVITRHIGGFAYDRTKGGFKNWLRRIAENKALDLLRKRREPQADSQVLRAALGRDPSPADVWEQQWSREHLRFCLEQIRGMVPADQYEAFRMLLFDQSLLPTSRPVWG